MLYPSRLFPTSLAAKKRPSLKWRRHRSTLFAVIISNVLDGPCLPPLCANHQPPITKARHYRKNRGEVRRISGVGMLPLISVTADPLIPFSAVFFLFSLCFFASHDDAENETSPSHHFIAKMPRMRSEVVAGEFRFRKSVAPSAEINQGTEPIAENTLAINPIRFSNSNNEMHECKYFILRI